MRICRDCRYGVAIDGEVGLLECRRHPPQVSVDDDGFAVSTFPVCEPHLWCGDYEKERQLGGLSNYAQEW